MKGFSGSIKAVKSVAAIQHVGDNSYTYFWSTLGHFNDNPMGISWVGIVLGLGAIISFGYWITEFLLVQRILSTNNLRSAKMAPIIGAIFKMAAPFIVIFPGLICLCLIRDGRSLFNLAPGRCRQGRRPTRLRLSRSAHVDPLLWPRPARSRHHALRRIHASKRHPTTG